MKNPRKASQSRFPGCQAAIRRGRPSRKPWTNIATAIREYLEVVGDLTRGKIDQEEHGRFIAEVVDLPGVLAYGQSREEALALVQALALRVLADRVEHGESLPEALQVFAVAA